MLRRSAVDVISPFLDPYQDVIMSVEGTRMRLLALSSLVPGERWLGGGGGEFCGQARPSSARHTLSGNTPG